MGLPTKLVNYNFGGLMLQVEEHPMFSAYGGAYGLVAWQSSLVVCSVSKYGSPFVRERLSFRP